nr:non-ribosomal peptide synthetase [Clostridium beijerinckii]
MSPMQEGMLFHSLLDRESGAYFEQAMFTINGELDIEKFEKSFNLLIEKYDILRTIFNYEKFRSPMQAVLKERRGKILFEDISKFKEKDVESYIQEYCSKDKKLGFDLTKDLLMRISIFKIKNYKFRVVWSHHHILIDGWCLSILINDFISIYRQLKQDNYVKQENEYEYSEYISWLQKQNKIDAIKYWRNYLDLYSNCAKIPLSYNLKQNEKNKRNICSTINSELVNKIKMFARKNSTTLNVVFQFVFGVLLQKYTNTQDVVFGAVVSGRNPEVKGIEKMVGLFINTIPVRILCNDRLSIVELVRDLQERNIRSMDYDYLPLADIQSETNQKQNLINHIIVFENYPMDDRIINNNDYLNNGFTIENFVFDEETNYDLDIKVTPGDTINLTTSYNSNLYDDSFINAMNSHFINILNFIVENPQGMVSDIDILSEKEKHQILYEFNDTKADYPSNKTIQELFEEQAEKTPDNIAVVFEDEKLTYRELNEKSNSLARLLREKGVGPDSIVGIMVERSPEMIIGIMGILKSGGAYLPIDISFPKERIEYMLEDSESNILLSKNNYVENIKFNGGIVDLSSEESFIKDSKDLEKVNKSSDLAYVIYTSGTTGNPKGVMIEHKSLHNYLGYAKYKYCSEANIYMPLYTSVSFDLTVTTIFTPLISGKSIFIYENTEVDRLAKSVFCGENTSVIKATPSHLRLIKELKNVNKLIKRFIVGGEEFPEETAKYVSELFDNNIEIINEYGPTETTIGCVVHKYCNNINYKNSILIGKPIRNTQIVILDRYNNILPIGVAGELYIAGHGLARGYLNRSELTAEKFIDNPFEPGTKMYKTGDLARWLPDGNIEYLGRIDNQVKIRGFRIELGEIESRILELENVIETTVLAKEDKNGEKYLCAYVVSNGNIDDLELRSYLKESLPEYMVPSYFMRLEKMPLTRNGKIDRRALPEPNLNAILTEYEAPRNEVEEILASIWSEVLGIEKIGINDNFFEIGGHSLKAMMLISKIHKELNKEVPLKELFRLPTIKELSKYIESIEENPYSMIEKAEVKEYYEASSAQKRMYLLQQFNKDSTAYNMPAIFKLEGEVNKEKLESVFKKLVERHENLRTCFKTIDGEIVQIIKTDNEFKLTYITTNSSMENILSDFVKPFDLEKGSMLRAELVEVGEINYLLIDMHHIISDGISKNIIECEFADLYNDKELEPLKLQYKDFSEWQNNFLKSKEMKKQEEYWLNVFSDEIPVLNMPTDYKRPVMQSFEGDSVSFELNEETTLKLRKLTKETGTTMHMVLLSAFNIILSKYTGQEDIIVGTPVAGRPHADLENIIGLFVNTLALRNKPEGNKKYIDFLKEVKENSLKAYENQSYQLETLIDKLEVKRDMSRNPLFDVMFNIASTLNNEKIDLDDLFLKSYDNSKKTSKFDMTLNAIENDEKINLSIQYCTKLFKEETIKRFINHYLNILKVIIENREIELKEIDILSEEEKHQILYEFNDTKADYPKDKTIQELFEEQVEKTPDNIAIVFEDKKLTYRELNEKSNSLARLLREKGVRPNSIVGIMVERSPEMIIGIMGILKSGGAYLPIDTSFPKDRIEYMLEDSKSNILLSRNGLVENLKFDGTIVDLSADDSFIKDSHKLEVLNTCADLVYLIYTSGTTGKPKGVMVSHYNLTNYVTSIIKKMALTKYDESALLSSFAFDLSYTTIFTSLIVGGKLKVISDENYKNPIELARFLMNDISYIKITPSLFNMILSSGYAKEVFENSKLKLIIIGGESINRGDLVKLRDLVNKKNIKIVNHYGPTESTVGCIVKFIDFENTNNFINIIGTPLANVKAFILDNNYNMCGVNIPGELCISGEGLSRGYLNKPSLTEEKFIDNPFELGTKIYKTGDLARWLPDGNIEFLGRIDNQVKIRGFRIELGEIENRLLENENIKEATVLVKENKDGEKYICAYVVSENSLEELDLRNYLRETLPEYMIPSYFVKVEKMPLTRNGKINRRALPEPNLNATLTEYEAPRNEVEEILASIWSEVLGIEKIGINDNFFEIGGHSLKAMMLISKIHKELNKEVPLKELFRFPTIKELSKYIESTEENPYSMIEKAEVKEYYEASSAQKRMYLLQQFNKDSTAYNMPAIFKLEGGVNKEKLESVFKKLVERHENLRTCFKTVDGEIVQIIKTDNEFKLTYITTNSSMENILSDFIKPFDLEKDSMLRAELVEVGEINYLLIDMHHIISDGISKNIIEREFADLYNDKELEPLKLQYKDFSEWQNNFLKSKEMKKQEEYWLNVFSDEIPVLNMPTDYKRPVMQSFEGDSVGLEIDEEIALGLRKLTKETGTTMHMVLLSAFNIILSKYTGQEDIIVGTPVAGRPHADLENIMGLFVNTLALRNKPEGNKKYIDFLKEVKENSLKAYENQSYQLETLIDKLEVKRDMSRNPLFNVMFNIASTLNNEKIDLDGLFLKSYDNSKKTSKFDMTLNAIENDEKINLSIQYCTKLFKEETIKRFINHYLNILKAIVENREIELKEIDILSEEERDQLLYEFNDTKADYPKDKTIQELFEEQVEKTPDNIAIVFEDKKLTYRELNEKSNSLARLLREKGVRPNSIVGIMVERSPEMIIGIMGILKSGGAYLPIDPMLPKSRIEYMLNDSSSNILLSEKRLIDGIDYCGELVDIYVEKSYIKAYENLDLINKSTDLSYIIYTSGTTGEPKGVMIEHKSVCNLVFGLIKKVYSIYKGELKVGFISPYYFDASVKQIFTTLLNGHSLYISDENTRKDGAKLLEFYRKNQIDISDGTPLHINIVNNFFSSEIKEVLKLKHFIVGGESLQINTVKELLKNMPNIRISNVYGPTECCVDSSIVLIDKKNIDCMDRILIGKPMPNYRIYILDQNNKETPIGVNGELCISGDGLSRGYLNRLELTGEKFIDNPFDPGTKMYKTGDLARWLPDGNIEFLGRNDSQVKIRGFRIELGEIESRLLELENVIESTVLAKEDKNGGKYLCAYVVSNGNIDNLELKSYLKERLPEYMIPSAFVELEQFPLTRNGKIDRRALPKPNLEMSLIGYESPRNEVEEALTLIWSEVLGVERVGINDNFFELGGQSLSALLLASKIFEYFNIDIPTYILYEKFNVRLLSEYILDLVVYKNNYFLSEADDIKKLTDYGAVPLYAFPGAEGYGVYFDKISRKVKSCSFYTFNFVECDNPIDKFVEMIMEIQTCKECILMGYSAGGSIAFEVGKRLISKGYVVSDIIMLDSYVKERKRSRNIEEIRDEVNKVLNSYGAKGKFNMEYIKKTYGNKMERYQVYLDKNVNSGAIESNIHVISAKNSNTEELKKWKSLTMKEFNIYQGFGTHTEMMLDGYIEYNAELVEKILGEC